MPIQTDKLVARAALALLMAAIAEAAVACGSDSSNTGGGASGLPEAGMGGIYGYGAGGGTPFFGSGGRILVGNGGVVAAGGFPLPAGNGGVFNTGGMGVGGGLGGSGDDGGLGGGSNPDASAGTGGTPGDAALCVPPATPVDTSALAPCGAAGPDQCTDGKCVPLALVPVDAQALLADCDAATKCVPDIFVKNANKYTPIGCRSVNDTEGRCLSLCIPQVSDQATFLPQANCAATERCTPCYDPRTGANTKACNQGCDTGPVEDPKIFSKCCTGRGSCVPKDVVPTADQAQLGADSCTQANFLCAPDKLTDSAYKPPKCNSLAGLEGRCLPDCVPAVAEQKDRLPRDTCEEGDLCAPCYDPITGSDTGACTRGDDVPVDPPTTFPTCCGTLGHCVPKTILSTDQQGQLGKDTCAATDDLCAPDIFATPDIKPEVCRALGSFNAEGRCVPACVPSVAAQSDRLDQATCDDGFLCAPCFDPITGVSTGACGQNGDPPVEPPKTFTDCCGGIGSCVPTAIVPDADESQLGKDTCTGNGLLCVPDKLSDPDFKPKECDSISGAEGRCMAACLPAVSAQKDRLPKDVCDTGELCAPCYDPITGADTGACTRGGDAPKDPPFTFPKCCDDLGHCVPTSVLSTAQQSQLGKDTCTGASVLCAPDVFAIAGQTPEACRSLGSFNAEGRCIPDCVPSVAAQASRLDRATCDAGFLCAPCWDPITGLDTGACTQNGDAPKETKKTFPACCGQLGLCVPNTLVPADQASQLGRDSCSAGNLCAPKNLTNPAVKPVKCRAPGDMEARCLPACLPPIQAQASNLRPQTCATGELCAPCYNPLDGTDTGACHLNGDAPVEPPFEFAGCCTFNNNDRGTCVPPELVTAAQAQSLPPDTCDTGFLCAPNLKVENQANKFPTCTIPFGALECIIGCTGGCVPDCIITDALQKGLLMRRGCSAGELCAPCFDPLGNRTGACD